MSYNIDNTKTSPKTLLTLTGKQLRKIHKKYEDDFPEDCFLHSLDINDYDDEQIIEIKDLSWVGVGSGRGYDVLEEILKETNGYGKVKYIWEDGESTILEVKDGVVKHEKEEEFI
jgi:hypothetical protein